MLCAAVAAASFTTDLTIKQCDAAGCKPVKKRIALDVTSNSTSSSGEKLINVGGAGMDELILTYGGADVGGPRVYLIEEDGVNHRKISTSRKLVHKIKNQEFAFDVELSCPAANVFRWNDGERRRCREWHELLRRAGSGWCLLL